MSRPQLPDKLYFRIGEVAEIVGVEPHVLRYWETEFRSIRPEKSRKGQRVYSRRDVEMLAKVKELLYGHRFTIEGAKRKLRGEGLEPVDATDPSLRELRTLRVGIESLRTDLVAALASFESVGGA